MKTKNIAEIIIENLASGDKDYVPSKTRRFYISDMGKCARMRWVKRHGVSTEFEPHVRWILQIGKIYHDYIYKVLEEKGLVVAQEERLGNDHFSGRFDLLLKIPGGFAVADAKSAGAYKINMIVNGQDDLWPMKQVLTYQMFIEDYTEYTKVKKSIIIYANKEPGDKSATTFVQRDYLLTPEIRKELQKEMDDLVNHWEKKTVPQCTCPGWYKPYNNYMPFCNADVKTVKKVLKNLKKGKVITTKKDVRLIDEKGNETNLL